MAKKKKSTEFNRILLYGVIIIALIIVGYYGFKSVSGSSAANLLNLGGGLPGNVTNVDITPQSGDVTATLAADSPAAYIVLGNHQYYDAAKYKFSATGSGFTVQKIAIVIPTHGWASVDTLKIEYPLKTGQIVSKEISVSAEKSKFEGLAMYVPKNGSAVMNLKATFKKVGTIGEGGEFRAHIKFGLASGVTAGDFLATSDGGGVIDTKAATQNIFSAEHVLYNSTPIVTASNPSGSGTIVPGGIINLYKFKVSADTAGEIAIKKFTFSIFITDASTTTPSGADLTNFTFLRGGTDITASAQITMVSNNGSTYITTPLTLEDTNYLENNTSYLVQVTFANTPATDANGEQSIGAGQTVEYTLRAQCGTGFTTTDAISTALLSDQAVDPGIGYPGGYVYLTDLDSDVGKQQIIGLQKANGTQFSGSTNFVWSDKSVLIHLPTFDDDGVIETSSADWTQGYLVKNFPLSVYGYTL
ncbi:MAG: hypothetical protein WC805_03095 [Patescibacteria group bacterium]|jgi:hypothetical protein